jgi:hypothetical protein
MVRLVITGLVGTAVEAARKLSEYSRVTVCAETVRRALKEERLKSCIKKETSTDLRLHKGSPKICKKIPTPGEDCYCS